MRDLRAAVLALTLGLLLLCTARTSWADHSLGRSCLSCHALRSTGVEPGSRNIATTEVQDALYQANFYCGTKWVGGEPLDCSYCHGSGGDVANEIALAVGGANGSAHPVDVGGDSASYGSAIRITCNDCHNGNTDDALNPGPDLTPDTLCTKIATDGYPNHHSTVLGAAEPGSNNLAENPPRLSGRYGPLGGALSSDGGVDWTGGADSQLDSNELLCFVCHDGNATTIPPFSSITEDTDVPPLNDGTKASNIAYEYNSFGGGHNVPYTGVGSLTGKLPCYDCHDPHAAATPDNEALILNGADSPVNPYGTSTVSVSGYTGTNDRVVCVACHLGTPTPTVEGVVAPDFTDAAKIVFPFHQSVHSGVAAAGNCLQPNGGCHQSPHNTDFFRCLDCHSTARADASAHPTLVDPADPGFVGHIDAAFAGIGGITEANILSQHDIPYADLLGDDMSVAGNNGCLQCHDTRGEAAGAIVKGPGDAAKQKFSGSNREALSSLNSFCLACHSGTYPQFGSFPAPDVARYYTDSGHGSSSSFPSGNGAANIPCLECHLYHGSSAYKLLPGDRLAGEARVVKGYAYTAQTTGTVFPIGDATDSRKIDYIDYTAPSNGWVPTGSLTYYNDRITADDQRSGYLSNYTDDWSTYKGDAFPTGGTWGLWTAFGTSGDVRPNGQNDNRSLACGQDATNASATGNPKIGFCNACHFYSNSTDGANSTYGKFYTHEGDIGGTDCTQPTPNPTGSKRDFFKDCAECHDPHGSGDGTNDNLYMIRGKIKNGATVDDADAQDSANWTEVVFLNRGLELDGSGTADNSMDESNADNGDDLCNVCHSGLSWSNLVDPPTPPDHALGQRCTRCHPHGE